MTHPTLDPTISLPSGAVVTLRKMSIADMSKMSAAMKDGKEDGSHTTALLNALTIRIDDQGPYPRKFDWDRALTADRFTANIYQRAMTHGERYSFKVTCGHCSEKKKIKTFDWEVDLLKDLEFRPVPDESRRWMREDKPVPVTLPTGERAHVSLLYREHERDPINRDDGEFFEKIIARRIVRIEDGPQSPPAILEWVGMQEITQAYDYIDLFDALDGGVDLSLVAICEHCEGENDVILPLGESFYLGREKTKRPGQKASRTGRLLPTRIVISTISSSALRGNRTAEEGAWSR